MKTIEINPTVESVSRDILELAKNPATVSTAYSQATIDYLNARQEIYANKKPGFLSRKNISFTIFGSIFTLVSASLLAPSIKDWFPGKSEPTISDTEKDRESDWPEGYKPSALQLELQKMLPPFPPKEITDPKLSEQERNRKYEEAILNIFRDSEVSGSERMTAILMREMNILHKLLKANHNKIQKIDSKKEEYFKSKGYMIQTDVGQKGLRILVSYDRTRDLDRIQFRPNWKIELTTIVPLTENNKNFTLATFGGLVLNFNSESGEVDLQTSSGNLYKSFLDNMQILYIEGEHNELEVKRGNNTFLKRKFLNTILAMILLSNDTFDLDKYDENGNLLPVKIDKEELKKKISKIKRVGVKEVERTVLKPVEESGILTNKNGILEEVENSKKLERTSWVESEKQEVKLVNGVETQQDSDAILEEINYLKPSQIISEEKPDVPILAKDIDSKIYAEKILGEAQVLVDSEFTNYKTEKFLELQKQLLGVSDLGALENEKLANLYFIIAKIGILRDGWSEQETGYKYLRKSLDVYDNMGVQNSFVESVRNQVEDYEHKIKLRNIVNIETVATTFFPEVLSFKPGKKLLVVNIKEQAACFYDAEGKRMDIKGTKPLGYLIASGTGEIKKTKTGLAVIYKKEDANYTFGSGNVKGRSAAYSTKLLRAKFENGVLKKQSYSGLSISGIEEKSGKWAIISAGSVFVRQEDAKKIQETTDIDDYVLIVETEIPKGNSLQEVLEEIGKIEQLEKNKTKLFAIKNPEANGDKF